MIHSMSLEVDVAYSMYLKVSEGKINQTQKDDNIFDFWTFHYLLSNHMINYNPTHCKYAGDSNIKPATQNNQATREKKKDASRGERGKMSEEEVEFSNFKKSEKPIIAEVPIHVCVGISHS